jgi:hypothetical protein
LGVKVEDGVGESREGVAEADDVVCCQVGEEVGVRGRVAVGEEVGGRGRVVVGEEVEVARIVFPSASEREKPPSSKAIDTRAMINPKNTCHKFFIACSLQATLARLASGR